MAKPLDAISSQDFARFAFAVAFGREA